mgnify:CR=1 FL=1
MIFFDNVSKMYNRSSVALQDVTLRIAPKEFVSIVGTSGAGKTTLLKLLIREEEPTSGRIFLDGFDITDVPRRDLHKIRRRVGTVFQDYKLLPAKTAYENVAFAMEVAGRTAEEIKEDVPQAIHLVGLEGKENNFPHQLSGGEKQRVAIARALINRPDVVLADEPTGNLDPLNTADIVNLLLKVNGLGTTVILATHDSKVVNDLGRRVITFDGGRIISDKENGTYMPDVHT